MRNIKLVLGVVFCGWSAWASLPGDLNGDGAVDVADLERAGKIASGALAFEAAADVDGDAVVTEIDVWLIQEATLGRPIPERVDSAVIGSAGGTLTHGDITVTFPPGATGQNNLSLFRCPNETLADHSPLHNVYLVSGLSQILPDFPFSITIAATIWGCAQGHLCSRLMLRRCSGAGRPCRSPVLHAPEQRSAALLCRPARATWPSPTPSHSRS